MAERAHLERTQRLFTPPSMGRLLGGLAVALAGPVLSTPLTMALPLDDVPSVLYLLCAVAATLVGRLLSGLVCVLASSLLLDYYFLAPTHSLSLTTREVVELGAFALVSVVVAELLARQDKARSEADAARRRLSLLAEASAVLGRSLDYEKTLAQLASLSVPQLGDWCTIHLWNGRGTIENVAVAHADPAKVEMARDLQRRYPPDPSALQGVPRVMRTGHSELYRQISDALLVQGARDQEHLAILRRLGFRSAIVAPLSARGRTLGALTLVTSESGRRYDEADLRMAEELGERAGLAIDNARLFRDREHIAHALQQSLLPPALPNIPGFELAAFHQPGREGHEVGGDFYDAFEVPGGWVLNIGDICGKGPEAAGMTGLVRHTLRAVSTHEADPARVLEALNDAILGQDVADRFCTVCYVRLHPEEGGGRLVVAAAGHPLPIEIRADGTLQEVGRHGTLLGVYPDPAINQVEARLGPGDALVLYTDGLMGKTEAQATIEHGPLGSALRASTGRSAAQIAESIERYWVRLPAESRTDDVAVLVVRAHPGGELTER